jgi:hypothetical protein
MPKITIEVQRPRGSFPGRVEIGWYEVVDRHVVLTDENGRPVGDKRYLNPGADARLIACAMLRQRSRGSRSSRSGFNRQISYPKTGYC